jgi:serine/threonine protein kinase
MKITYNATYTQVEEYQNSEGTLILKQRLKESALNNSTLRSIFLSGARFLQTLKDPNLLTIDEVIETNDEVSITCINPGFQQLSIYLSSLSNSSENQFSSLILKMIDALNSLNKKSLFHQGLNPNSFVVDALGDVKLTFFGTIEHRMYHQIPFIGSDNSSIQNAFIFYSPERKINYGAINQASEYYSLGLIIWYVLCIKQKTLLNSDSFVDIPPYVNTGSIWDSLIEVCLNEEPKKRPKSFIALSDLLPKLVVEKKSAPKKNIVLPPKPADLSSKIVNVKLYNYNYFYADILIDGVELANIKHRMDGRTLILEVKNTSEIQIYNKETKLLIKSFNCSHRLEFSLPGVFDEKTKSPSPSANIFLLLIFGIVVLLLLVWGHNAYFNKDNNGKDPSDIENVDGPVFDMIPPDGYDIKDPKYNDLLRNVGLMVESDKWRFKDGNWEKFITDASNSINGIWTKDDSQKDKLLENYFKLKDVIESEYELPEGYVDIIRGNDSLLSKDGKQTLDGYFYRYVDYRWWRKEGETWKKLVSFADYKDVLESYFINYSQTQLDAEDYGHVEGEGVGYRSEPSDRNDNTILGYFTYYKTDSDGNPLTKYQYTNPDHVSVLFEKNGWYLVEISENSYAWMSKYRFVSESESESESESIPVAPTVEEDTIP